MADGREVLELEPEQEIDDLEEQEQPEGDVAEEEDGGEGGDTETVIGFEGEEAAPASESDNSTIREMRKQLREKAQRIAELERANAPKRIEVGEEPTLEGCEYDEDRFKVEWPAWKARVQAAQAQEAEAEERTKADKEAWDKRIQAFEAGKSRLSVPDFEDAEAEVQAVLPPEILAIILHSDKSAEMVYALARTPAKLEELSKLNPLRAAMMIGKLEDRVQTTTRKLPDPDRPLRGNAAPANADKELARLEKKAAETGDRTELVAYKRKLKSRA